MKNILILLTLLPLIYACGSGDKDNDAAVSGDAPTIIALDEDAKVSQAVELLLLTPDMGVSDILWQQTSGELVTFLAQTSKVIAFTPTVAGQYSFNVSFTLEDGTSKTLDYTLTVSPEQSYISARLGHAVLEGSKVSLRATINDELSATSLVWQQISGPDVSFTDSNTDGQYAVFFDAPAVEKDTLLTFSVSANGHSDIVGIIVENAETINSGQSDIAYKERLARVFPFINNSPYADVLVGCVYSNEINFNDTCQFNELPLIAQDTTTPSIDDIMDRVVVSHHWMGENFREFLENNDPHDDFKNLLRATTAIVISYDVRPSYYWVVTGAIHLDANYFWLTTDERDTINQAPDYRASFGSDLEFEMPWRYVKNNNYTTTYIAQNARESRQPEDILFGLTSLMYHELAHANDFFPPSSWSSLQSTDEILVAAQKISNTIGYQSDRLTNTLPLLGDEMFGLAQVRFHGVSANETQKSYQPSDIAAFFSSETAPQFYNYSSIREDYAMLFDGFMMKARYDISRDVAVTNSPKNATETYVVNWGQRGRIGEESIKPRVLYAVKNILPEFTNAESTVNALPEPIMMNSGGTWADNLAISPMSAIQSKRYIMEKNSKERKDRRFIQHHFYEKPVPLK
ncbi:MAG: hypothetical protein HRT53_20395 [Colwellia sp.]|nr:hypothetical protein [Colwellia sp.]